MKSNIKISQKSKYDLSDFQALILDFYYNNQYFIVSTVLSLYEKSDYPLILLNDLILTLENDVINQSTFSVALDKIFDNRN